MATISASPVPLSKNVGGKAARPNEFLAVIDKFNDGGTRQITPDAGESMATLLDNLRAAARTIGRSVSINWVNAKGDVVPGVKGKSVPEGATGFRFMLRDLITRAPKATDGAETVEASVTPTASAKGAKVK